MTGDEERRGWWSRTGPYVITSCCIVGAHAAFGVVLFSMSFSREFRASYEMNPGIALVTYPIVFLLGIESTLEVFGSLGLLVALFSCAVCALSRYTGSLLRVRWWLLSLLLCTVFLCVPFPRPHVSSFLDEVYEFFFSAYPRVFLVLFTLILWAVLLVSDARRCRRPGAQEGGDGGQPLPR